MRSSSKLRETRLAVMSKADVSPEVAHLIAVVGGREDCDALSVMLYFVSFLFHLVRADEQREIVLLQPFLRHVRSEHAARASFALCSSLLVLGVTPEKVAHDSSVSWLNRSIHLVDVRKGDTIISEQTTMTNEHLAVKGDGEREIPKQLNKTFVHMPVMFGNHFSLETVHLIHCNCLMVSAGEVNGLRIKALVSQQRHDNFQ
mmetsp:Transcript_24138/g.54201  ORF Transcript_24138/g.54201 Transcript_24138/m.54201 type:complete len:202 (-) Transcript_24138:924-1529(-)